MLKGKGLPNQFWAEAVNTAVYILNRSYTKALKGQTPHEAYSGKNLMFLILEHLGVNGMCMFQMQTQTSYNQRAISVSSLGL